MPPSKPKRDVRAGKSVLAVFLTSSSSLLAELMGLQGYDVVTLDLQHSESSTSDVQRLVHATLAGGATAVVRVPGNDAILIQRSLDLGAYGVIVPYINTAEEAAAVVRAAKYPPLGERSWGPVRGAFYGKSDYFHRANEELLTIVMLETRTAAENAAAILSVDGIDGCLIGPNDLAVSYGYPSGLPNLPAAAEVGVERILAAAEVTGKFAGIVVSTATEANARLAQGFRWIQAGSDVRFAVRGAGELLAEIKR